VEAHSADTSMLPNVVDNCPTDGFKFRPYSPATSYPQEYSPYSFLFQVESTVGAWGRGAVGPWGRGAVVPWCSGAVGAWGRGAAASLWEVEKCNDPAGL
jgi:hypothetical protein